MATTVVVDALRKVRLFADIPTGELQAVASTVHASRCEKGQRIFEEGTEADCCFVLLTGRAKVVISSESGTEVILGSVGPGQLVGELALLDRSTRSASLIATEDCELITLTRASFATLRTNQAFEDRLIVHITSMLRRATEQLRAIYTFNSLERVSWCLGRLAATIGTRAGDRIEIAPRPQHQELADMTGCTRETVTRVMRRLRQAKQITWNATAYSLDAKAFHRYLYMEPGMTALERDPGRSLRHRDNRR